MLTPHRFLFIRTPIVLNHLRKMSITTRDLSFEVFPQFPRLPPELRFAIWCECLPNRVVELDYPWDEGTCMLLDPPPCKLRQTTDINRKLPVISRVCRESRLIALEKGNYYDYGEVSPPVEAEWISHSHVERSWVDPSRDTIHLNWTPCYEAEHWADGSALDYLAWSAARARGGSFMFDYLDNEFDGDAFLEERIEAFQQLQHGRVVMRVIVVHSEFQTAAETGLFGLLGDACVQLVDVSDEQRLDAFFEFAEKCESDAEDGILWFQDFDIESPELANKSLKDKLAETFGAQAALSLAH